MEREAEKRDGFAASLQIEVSDLRDHALALPRVLADTITEMVEEAAPLYLYRCGGRGPHPRHQGGDGDLIDTELGLR